MTDGTGRSGQPENDGGDAARPDVPDGARPSRQAPEPPAAEERQGAPRAPEQPAGSVEWRKAEVSGAAEDRPGADAPPPVPPAPAAAPGPVPPPAPGQQPAAPPPPPGSPYAQPGPYGAPYGPGAAPGGPGGYGVPGGYGQPGAPYGAPGPYAAGPQPPGAFAPGPGYAPYGPGGGGWPGAPLPTGMSVTSLVLGIIGLVLISTCWGSFLAVIVSPIALGLGLSARRKADRGELGGRGQAVGGFVTGLIGTVLSVIVAAFVVFVMLVVPDLEEDGSGSGPQYRDGVSGESVVLHAPGAVAPVSAGAV